MTIKNPWMKSVFCAIIITLLFFIVFSAQGNQSFNQTVGILIGIPITFACTFLYCCLLIFLEQVRIIAPNWFCRFAVPFSFCCLMAIIISIYNNTPIVENFQQYSFLEYCQELAIPLVVLFTINSIIAIAFTVE